MLLLCYPRILGWVFNPLSVYFAYDRTGTLAAVIYEVRNTFGEKHSYVAPVAAGELTQAGLRQKRRKLFYVSPFNGHGDARTVSACAHRPRTSRVRILETDAEGPLLSATFHGVRKALTSSTLLSALARVPFLTLKVVAGIHWEALRLWIKGMRLVPRPPAPPPVSYGEWRWLETLKNKMRTQRADLARDRTAMPSEART